MRISGTLKKTPDDFIVHELPLYEPSGTGEHVYITFEKRGLNTLDAAQMIARALGSNPRDTGIAGMKDKIAVTTQTISVQAPRGVKPDELVTKANTLALDGIRILRVGKHGNKLKTGHLAGNRFSIRIHDIPKEQVETACNRLLALAESGVPNAFGEQRFGRDADNAARALAWLRGEAHPPRDPRKKRLLYSALQSAIFNAVLDRRVADKTWNVPLVGDVLKKTDSGGLFVCEDLAVDQARARNGEVTPTGPIFGPKMTKPAGDVALVEQAVMQEVLGAAMAAAIALHGELPAARGLGEGTRRSLVLQVSELAVHEILPGNGEHLGSCAVDFVIPKGAYATTVLGQVFEWPLSQESAFSADPSKASPEIKEDQPDD